MSSECSQLGRCWRCRQAFCRQCQLDSVFLVEAFLSKVVFSGRESVLRGAGTSGYFWACLQLEPGWAHYGVGWCIKELTMLPGQARQIWGAWRYLDYFRYCLVLCFARQRWSKYEPVWPLSRASRRASCSHATRRTRTSPGASRAAAAQPLSQCDDGRLLVGRLDTSMVRVACRVSSASVSMISRYSTSTSSCQDSSGHWLCAPVLLLFLKHNFRYSIKMAYRVTPNAIFFLSSLAADCSKAVGDDGDKWADKPEVKNDNHHTEKNYEKKTQRRSLSTTISR